MEYNKVKFNKFIQQHMKTSLLITTIKILIMIHPLRSSLINKRPSAQLGGAFGFSIGPGRPTGCWNDFASMQLVCQLWLFLGSVDAATVIQALISYLVDCHNVPYVRLSLKVEATASAKYSDQNFVWCLLYKLEWFLLSKPNSSYWGFFPSFSQSQDIWKNIPCQESLPGI